VAPVGRFKREVGVPVFHAARISDIASARHAVAEGLIDMVGMTRAHIADPHLVNKLAAGREAEVRPCVGATHCQSPARPACLHNPATGRENKLPQIIAKSETPGRKVVVIGGGPGGLEAARVCAERGHAVNLFEAASQLGGQVLIGARGPWRQDLRGLIDWRASEISRLGVHIHLNTFADASDVFNLAPDVVIVATGGVPDLNWLDGHEHVTTVFDALTGQAPFTHDVLVFDGTGRHPAPHAATLAADAGSAVSLVSIDSHLAAELTYGERNAWKEQCYRRKINCTFDHSLLAVRPSGNRLAVTLRNEVTLETSERMADQVIVEHGTVPADEIYRDLRAQSANDGVTNIDALLKGDIQPRSQSGGFELHRIGDAVASRNVHAAVLDALRLCAVM